MSKTTKIIAIILIAFVGVVTFWLPSAISDAKKRMDTASEEAITEGNEILILACSAWSTSSIELRLITGFDTGALQTQMNSIKVELGEYRRGEMKIDSFRVDDSNLANTRLVADLSTIAEFSKGQTKVNMTLVREPKNAWLLEKISFAPVVRSSE